MVAESSFHLVETFLTAEANSTTAEEAFSSSKSLSSTVATCKDFSTFLDRPLLDQALPFVSGTVDLRCWATDYDWALFKPWRDQQVSVGWLVWIQEELFINFGPQEEEIFVVTLAFATVLEENLEAPWKEAALRCDTSALSLVTIWTHNLVNSQIRLET